MTGLDYALLRYSGRFVQLAIAAWVLALVGALAGWWPPDWRWAVYLPCTALVMLGMLRWTRALRERYVREAALPHLLRRKLREIYPHLGLKESELAERGLRQFFLACLRSRGLFVAMPSRAVEALWNAFIRNPEAYADWCRHALGFQPEYAPAEVLGKKAHHNDGLRRAWYWACTDEAIDPRHPSRLPLLFALDAKLSIPEGFRYVPGDIASGPKGHSGTYGTPYSGTSFSDTSYSGGWADFGGCESATRRAGGKEDTETATDDDGDGGD